MAKHFTRKQMLAGSLPFVAAAPLAKLAWPSTAQGGERSALHMGHDASAPGPRRDDRRRGSRSGRAACPGRRPLPAEASPPSARPDPRVRPHRSRPHDRGRPGRPLRCLELQRLGPGADHPRDRGRPPARQLHERRLAPAHDPLPRDPPREDGRRLRDRPARRLVHVRVPGAPGRDAALPLPRDAAEEAHPQGPLRRVHHRPEEAACRPPASS